MNQRYTEKTVDKILDTEKIPTELYSRVAGYFRPVNQWHIGKQEEYKERKPYKLPEVLP